MRKLRESKGYTQKDVAEKIGVSVATIKNWEHTGKEFYPQVNYLYQMAKMFQIDIRLFFTPQIHQVENIFEEPEKKYNKLDFEERIKILEKTLLQLNWRVTQLEKPGDEEE